mmetsp:Transcript_26667/g.37538  ORF Transcript_26667/g.37538 Transcript_26667/m.37538 type:complete len:347 (+) Transcript_26667:180-1220(+)
MMSSRLLNKRLQSTNHMVADFKISPDNIGEGSTGMVRLAVRQSDGLKAAVKIVCKRSLRFGSLASACRSPGSFGSVGSFGSPSSSPGPFQSAFSPSPSPNITAQSCSPSNFTSHYDEKIRNEVMREVNLLQKLHHENIVKLIHIEEDDTYMFIFSEWMDEGDLYSYIQRNGTLDEVTALKLFKQMMAALQHCHESKVCHHDFKLENCVINGDLDLRVIDFGFAIDYAHLPQGELLHHYTGSPAYSAPEILDRRPHTESVDIFSLGTCLFYMLAGRFPFCDEEKTTYEQLCRNVRAGVIDFPDKFSDQVRDLLKRMLSKDHRITWDEIEEHAWLNSCANDDSMDLIL